MNRFSRRLPVSLALRAPLAVLAWPLVASTAAAQPTPTDAYREAGLLSPTEYQSPLFGYTMEWSADWAVDPARINPVLWFYKGIDRYENVPVHSTALPICDRIDIWNADLDARFRFTMQTPFDRIGATGETPGTTSLALGGRATTLLDTTDDESGERVVVHRHAMNDGSVLLAYNKHLDVLNETYDELYWLWFQVLAPEDDFAAAYAQAMTDIAVDGFALDGIVTIDEMMAAAAATPLEPASDWGITSGTSWEGLNYGVPVEWSPTITTRQNLGDSDSGIDSLVRGRTYGPANDAEVKVWVYVNYQDYTAAYLVEDTATVMASRGAEILLQHSRGNRGLLLFREVEEVAELTVPQVSYHEYFVRDDGSAWGTIQITAPMKVGVQPTFARWFGPLVGSITIDGATFGEYLDPTVIIAAALSPPDTESGYTRRNE